MPSHGPVSEAERITAVVFGDTFALYDERSFDEFVEPLHRRLQANGIDLDVFRGKRCLDAGCGGGRGSILMAQAGAREVVSVDLSDKNVETTRRWAEKKGLTNVHVRQHSLMELPFEDESFDVVWCNGVLHHITDPDRGLQEITRVLKIGGPMWLYLYGSGGTYWYVIDWIRETLRGIEVRDCIAQLRLMDVPVRRIAEWIDDWFAAYLRRYTGADVTARLTELGFEDTIPLARGVSYDTSHRRIQADAEERQHMGEGDVRIFGRKTGPPRAQRHPLPDPPGGKGSPFTDGPAVTQFAAPLARVTSALSALKARRGGDITPDRIIVARSIHGKVRSLLEAEAKFDAGALHDHLRQVAELLEPTRPASPAPA